MSCEDFYYKQIENTARQTWIKKIDEFDNIDYCIYTAKNISKHKYIKDEHKLILRCEDDIDNTFKKTYYAFNIANKIFEYDYIFRTNTSTYVNIELLNSFIQQLDNDEILWTSELYSINNSFCPYPFYLHGRGNGLIISKKLIDIILNYGKSFLYLEKCDDWLIGNILNTYWINHNKNYILYNKSYMHTWYKCAPNIYIFQYTNFYNENKNWDYLNKFITIQIKMYSNKELETSHYYEIDKVFKENKYDNKTLENNIKENLEYSKNPNIFIGYDDIYPIYNSYNEYLEKNKNKIIYEENFDNVDVL